MSDNEMDEAVDEGVQEEGTSKDKGPRSGKRFEIKKWNAVCMWSWAICTDTCAICRNNLVRYFSADWIVLLSLLYA
jgi:RING-box protein 1